MQLCNEAKGEDRARSLKISCVVFLAPGTCNTAPSTDLSCNKWMQKEKQWQNRNNGSGWEEKEK